MPVISQKNKLLGDGLGAANDLGLGDTLRTQVEDETEEQKRRRLLLQQQQQALNPMAGSAAARSLFGGIGGPGY